MLHVKNVAKGEMFFLFKLNSGVFLFVCFFEKAEKNKKRKTKRISLYPLFPSKGSCICRVIVGMISNVFKIFSMVPVGAQ